MKVLLVKTSSMGDVIHTFQAVEDVRRQRPDVMLGWCLEEAFADIVALHPCVSAIHPVAMRRWRKAPLSGQTWREARALRRALRDARYDLVIDAQGLLKSAVIARLAGSPMAGFDRMSAREPLASVFYDKRFNVPRGLHAIERTRRLVGQALGYAPDLADPGSGIEAPQTTAATGRSAFLLHGTSRADKKWPVSDWIAVARQAVERGLTPLTTFSNGEEQAVAEVMAAAVPETRVVKKSPLGEIAALIGGCELVIGADTGLTHLASAFGIPTVAVFLTTEPGLTGPRGKFAATVSAGAGQPVTPAAVMAAADGLMELASTQPKRTSRIS